MVDYLALISFVLITTFTPGPNNISSASMGIIWGYRKTLPYLLGIATGFFFIMILCGIIASTLYKIFPSIESVIRWFGAGYILWLAWHTLMANYSFKEQNVRALGFYHGLLLQLLNPKVIVYGLTLYSTFLQSIISHVSWMVVSAILLAMTSFSSISTWTLSGALIRNHLNKPKLKMLINSALSLLLVYSALDISGIIS